MKVGYVRVSTKDQSLARQVASMKPYNLDRLYQEKESGKDFNRPEYQRMREDLQAGDELYIKELDRLGRNKDELKEELNYFKRKGVIVRIMDVPTTMIDFEGQAWVGEMVTNIIIEVLSSNGEQERKTTLRRAREGVKEAQKRGVKFGRKVKQVDMAQLRRLNHKARAGEITHVQAYQTLGISKSLYYQKVSQM